MSAKLNSLQPNPLQFFDKTVNVIAVEDYLPCVLKA